MPSVEGASSKKNGPQRTVKNTNTSLRQLPYQGYLNQVVDPVEDVEFGGEYTSRVLYDINFWRCPMAWDAYSPAPTGCWYVPVAERDDGA